MSDTSPPAVPQDPTVVELTEMNAPRRCGVCGRDADYYVFITDGQYERRVGEELADDEWPVNVMLCAEHFRAAPRVDSWDELPIE